jgi:hypothetical protein
MNVCHEIKKRSKLQACEYRGLPTLKIEMMKLCPALRCVWADVNPQAYFNKSLLRGNIMTVTNPASDIATFFRREFRKISLHRRASEEIIGAILKFCAQPSNEIVLRFDDSWPVSALQITAVKHLIKLFIQNLKNEVQNIHRREAMN